MDRREIEPARVAFSGHHMDNWWTRYLERHQHPASRVLHLIGVPMLPIAGVLVIVQLAQWRWDLWWRPVALLILSYLLQWIGHRIEGNDLGEVVFIKRLLGLPYVAVSPRYVREEPGDNQCPGAQR